jgi:hypothetical protein
MKRTLFVTLVALCTLPTFLAAQSQPRLALPLGPARQEGMIVRMRTADCLGNQHGVMATLSGAGRVQTGEQCPEYVLVTEKVVYTIVGKSSDQLVPLAEVTRFRLQNNEMLIRVDDSRRENHFHIKDMMLRADWERIQTHMQEEMAETPQRQDAAMLLNSR